MDRFNSDFVLEVSQIVVNTAESKPSGEKNLAVPHDILWGNIIWKSKLPKTSSFTTFINGQDLFYAQNEDAKKDKNKLHINLKSNEDAANEDLYGIERENHYAQIERPNNAHVDDNTGHIHNIATDTGGNMILGMQRFDSMDDQNNGAQDIGTYPPRNIESATGVAGSPDYQGYGSNG